MAVVTRLRGRDHTVKSSESGSLGEELLIDKSASVLLDKEGSLMSNGWSLFIQEEFCV